MSMDLATAIAEEIVEMAPRESRSVGIVSTKYATLFEPPNELTLVGGARLGPIRVAYETYGELSPARQRHLRLSRPDGRRACRRPAFGDQQQARLVGRAGGAGQGARHQSL